MQELAQYIQSKIQLQSEVLWEILSAFDEKTYQKDRVIIREGQYVNKYYFIASGGVRIVIDTPTKEITAWLIFEHNFFSDLHALRSGMPSKSKIVAIEPTKIYSIDARKMHEFYERFPRWQSFGRQIIEDAFLNVVDTLISFLVMDAQTRYLQLLEKSEAIHRIPLKQLASYLGITPNSLSRIRKNIR
ncbi:MAG: Crp/Fnr family transcriptional regulator [Bacteroidota bacterium]